MSVPGDDTVARVLQLSMPLGDVTARRMFGGHGVFADGVMFAIVAGAQVYLKADGATVPDFEAAGSRPFTYRREAREVALSYWLVPDGGLEGMAAFQPWGEKALAAARRAKAGKKTG